MISILDPRALIAAIALCAASVGIGYWRGNVAGKASVQAAWNQERAEQAAAAYAAVEKAAAAVREELAAADQKHTEEMSHAKTENERLRAAARAGTVSVRLEGHCAGHAADLSETPFSSSLGHGVPALDAELRERVFDHRAAVIQAENQILYLQDYARLCAAGAAP